MTGSCLWLYTTTSDHLKVTQAAGGRATGDLVQPQKKHWERPEIVSLKLVQARELIAAALKMIESANDSEVAAVSSDLWSVVKAIETELAEPVPG